MADEKILMVNLAVTDMAKSKAFYAEQLGWAVTTDFGQGAHHWVSLELPGGGASVTLTTMHGEMKPGAMTYYLSTANIETTHSEFKAKGIETLSEVKDDLYGPGSGVKWFSIGDPDGNQWLVAQAEHGPR
jgi:predicted enzyme related to lactoylglutathione lyase